MSPEAVRGMDRILELQELDLSIDRLLGRQREIQGGEEAETARKMRDEARGRLGELRLALDSVDLETRRLEGDVDSLTRKADAEEARLYDGSVANPKELEAIQHEVANLRGRRSRIEDELLDQMVRKEDLEDRIRQVEGEVAEADVRMTEIMGSTAAELDEIESALKSRRTERDALAPEFDEELLELYEDLRRQKKGVGAAALIDGVCQGCHQKLSALELDRLKRSGGIRRCEYCRRILVVT
jgi:predicted  nucleic acid-binding Zn-ribbon protein